MSDVKVERKVSMTRQEAAEWLTDIGAALKGTGTVSIPLADSTVELHVPDSLKCEVEIEVDGDEVELELELKWSTGPAGGRRRANGGAKA